MEAAPVVIIVLYLLGCIAQNRLNGVDLDVKDPRKVNVRRQNVFSGCPCEAGECANNGTCQLENITITEPNTTKSWKMCKCTDKYKGPRCQNEDGTSQEEGEFLPIQTNRLRNYLWPF